VRERLTELDAERESRFLDGGPGGGSNGRLNLFSNAGTTPNYCSVEYNMWFYPDETFEGVRAEVEHDEVVFAKRRQQCGERQFDEGSGEGCRPAVATRGCGEIEPRVTDE